MEYKLIDKNFDKRNAMVTVLKNRGIEDTDIAEYLNTSFLTMTQPSFLGEEQLTKAIDIILDQMINQKEMMILVDCDCDGFSSSAILINYLHRINPEYVEHCVKYFIHENKVHGLSDCFEYAKNYSLVIIPDAASNDYEFLKILKENGTQVIILDHHEAPYKSEDAIVINNQLEEQYPSKAMTGAGIVFLFCLYMDSYIGTNYAYEFIDLAALGVCGDMATLLDKDVRGLLNEGFLPHNIRNPFFSEMIKKNSYSMGDKITPITVSFYIVPYINAFTRSGTLEENIVLFESMLEHLSETEVPSTKRGHKLGETETLVTQAVRLATNVKKRQTTAQDSMVSIFEQQIHNDLNADSKIILIIDDSNTNARLYGLIANKMANKYRKPCFVLRPSVNEDGVSVLKGSARGYTKYGIDNFKKVCGDNDPDAMFAGHPNAFGCELSADSIDNFISSVNYSLVDINTETDPPYDVDFVVEQDDDYLKDIILEIGNMDNLWGQDMPEPLIVIKDVLLTQKDITIYKKKTNTLKISLPNQNIELIKFCLTDDECELWENIESTNPMYLTYIDFVGNCSINTFLGKSTPQVKIVDYELKKKFAF